MSENHEHPQRIKFTIIFQPTWWGWQQTLVLHGTASGVKDGELLIYGHNGELHSINYARVFWMKAEPEDRSHAH